nr:Gfo/Idh/MocA family oxidoreductase [Brevibacillus sp. SYP-B805]
MSAAHVHFDLFATAIRACADTQLVAIYDDQPIRGKEKAEQYGVPFMAALEDALDQCEAVVVCSENAKHEEMVLAALEANKHVLCEKPLSTTGKSAEKMASKADERNLVLATAFPMRFNSPAIEMKKALAGNKIGEILAFHGTNQGKCPGDWFVKPHLAGGGAVMDHTVHLVDLMRWYTGAEIAKVYAEIDSFLHAQYDIDDVGHIQLLFSNGVIADLDPSWSRPAGYPTWGGLGLRVTGTKGVMDLNGFAQTISVYTSDSVYWEYWGESEYAYMIEGFVKRIGGEETSLASAWDGVAAVKVVEAAYLSAREKEFVPLYGKMEG